MPHSVFIIEDGLGAYLMSNGQWSLDWDRAEWFTNWEEAEVAMEAFYRPGSRILERIIGG